MSLNFTMYEIKRILKSRSTEIMILLSSITPLIGANIYKYIDQNIINIIFGINSSTNLTKTILFPTKIGAILSCMIFIALTVFEFNKMFKFRVHQIIEPISNPIKLNLSKIIGLIVAGAISVVMSIIIMLPHYISNVGSFNSINYYFLSYIIINFGAIVFSIMMSAGFYLIFRSVNVTYIIMFLAIMFSCLSGIIDYQYMWVQTGAAGFSDYFGVGNTILGMLWNRLFGFLVSLGILLIGFLFNRCYEKNLFKSFFKNCQKYKLLPLCLIISVSSAIIVFKKEPVFTNFSISNFIYALFHNNELPKNNNIVGTSDMLVDVYIDTNRKKVTGTFTQSLKNDMNTSQSIYFEVADGYSIDEIKLDNQDINYKKVSSQELQRATYRNIFSMDIPENVESDIKIKYSGHPKTLSISRDFSEGISNEYISLGRAFIAPVVGIDTIKNNNAITGSIAANKEFTVITTGNENQKIGQNQDSVTWSFFYDDPVNFGLTAGKYDVSKEKLNNTTVEFFYPKLASEELKSRGNDIIDVFSYFFDKFGPLSQNSLKLVVTSGVQGGGGHADGNISYVSEDCLVKTISTDSKQASESDTFSLLTHEIAHLWWGIGIKISNENSNNELDKKHDEWTSEAFADFSAYLFLKYKFFEKYANEIMLDKWKSNTNEIKRDFYYRNPNYIDKLSGLAKNDVLLNLKAYKMYALGPMDVYNIYTHVGEIKFFEGLKTIYSNYYKTGKILYFSDFLNIMGVSEEVVLNG